MTDGLTDGSKTLHPLQFVAWDIKMHTIFVDTLYTLSKTDTEISLFYQYDF